ncbi:hypothetical protein J116_010685 [Streptomyces thermolilacinus SPC6]|uniref:Uncharacterized protein n=1 Tax=Streptomyces thermolilacinus SPC6 TaxID=1306406 RepID=A0A1D3DRD1_9ACTN|nr:hypothetical protein J116_010685 [Streptomyces thermolilacinus SPC6]
MIDPGPGLRPIQASGLSGAGHDPGPGRPAPAARFGPGLMGLRPGLILVLDLVLGLTRSRVCCERVRALVFA